MSDKKKWEYGLKPIGLQKNEDKVNTDFEDTSPMSEPATYTPASEKGSGKAAYGLDFESSKLEDDAINVNSPFASFRITSKTGSRDTGIKGASKNHAGIDRAVPAGTAISVPMNTTFYASGYDDARGNWIEVKDANGYILHYQHLQDVGRFKQGQVIPSGTTLARSGSSGVGRAHLHEEYYSPDGKNVTESYWAKYAKSDGKIMPMSTGEIGAGTYIKLDENGNPQIPKTTEERQSLLKKAAEERQSALDKRFEDAGLKNDGKFRTKFDMMRELEKKDRMDEVKSGFEDLQQKKGLTISSIKSGISGVASGLANFIDMKNDEINDFSPLKKNLAKWAIKNSNPFTKYSLIPIDEEMTTTFIKAVTESANKWNMKNKEDVEKSIAEIDSEMGRAMATVYSGAVNTVTEQIPNVVIAFLTRGGSAAPAVANGVKGKLITFGANLLKNPGFYYSYMRTAGDEYKEALDFGASKTEARAAGHIIGILNAAVEYSGGMEKALPGMVGRTGFIKKLAEAWGKSAFEEGIEEGVQDNITSVVRKLIYKKDSPWVSVTDTDAVINPLRTGQSMLMGYLVGGILGTGGAAVSSVGVAFKNAVAPERQEIKEKFASLEERFKNGEFKGMTPEEINADSEVQELVGMIRKNSVADEESGSYSINVLPDGKRYVQAEEQVIKSSDPNAWEREIIDYVNNTVRHGHDFTILTDDGEKISITGRTAWKLGDKGRYNDKYYFVKGNASGVIDEVVQVSEPQMRGNQKNEKPGFKNHRNGFAVNGWQYRTAHFRDLDGQYYQLDLSVGKNANGNEMYNIGAIKKVPFPVTGSKAEGTTPHSINILQNGENVKRKIHPLNRTQRRFFSSFGIDVEVRENLPIGANAKILTKSGRVLVSPYAKVTGWELARHEFTHYIKTFYPKAYKGYVDAVKLEMGDKWQAEYDRVYKKYEAFAERYPDEGITLDEDVITEELVSEYAEGFENSDFMKRTAERDLSVAAYIRNALKNLIQRIKAIFTPAELRANRESIEYIMSAKDMWEKAVIEVARSPRTAWKNSLKGKMYSIGSVIGKNGILNPSYTASELSSNAMKILDMESVKDLTGEEFGHSDVPLIDRVLDFFKSLNNEVISEELGRVALTKTSFKDDVNHGLTERKIQAFAAIPEVIKNGKVIFINSKGSERVVVAAPITIAGEKYYMGVMLKRNAESQRLYIHDVITEKEATVSETGAGTPEHNRDLHRDTENLFLTSILQRALAVKGNFSYTPPTDTETESEPYAFGYDIDDETKSEESGHDWEIPEEDAHIHNTENGEESIVDKITRDMRARAAQWKQEKAGTYVAFLLREIGIRNSYIKAYEREHGRDIKYYGMKQDIRQLTYELRLAERAVKQYGERANKAEVQNKKFRRLFINISSAQLSAINTRVIAEKYKKLTEAHMPAKDIAVELQKAYSVLSAMLYNSRPTENDGAQRVIQLAKDMLESRKLSGNQFDVTDEDVQTIAEMLADEFYNYIGSAEGKQNTVEVLKDWYEAEHSHETDNMRAYIEFLEEEAKKDKKEEFQSDINRLAKEDDPETEAYTEEETHEYNQYFGKLKTRGIKVIRKKSVDGSEPDVVYIKFDHNTTNKLRGNPVYKNIIRGIKEALGEGIFRHGRHTDGRYELNDIYRDFEMFFKREEDYEAMKKLVLDPFDDAKFAKEAMETFYFNMYEEKIVKGFGIKAGSKMDKAMQYYGEWVKPGKEDSADDSSFEASKAWHSLDSEERERVKAAEKVYREIMNGLFESINYGRRTVFPDADRYIEVRENEKSRLSEELEIMKTALADGDFSKLDERSFAVRKMERLYNEKESAEKIYNRVKYINAQALARNAENIKKIEQQLSEVKNKDSLKYMDLQKQLAKAVEKQKELQNIADSDEKVLKLKIERTLARYESAGEDFAALVKDDVERISKRIGILESELSADFVAYGRTVEKRENYFHHIREEIGNFAKMHGFFATLINNGSDRGMNRGVPGDADNAIDLELVGVSDTTKPKGRFHGALQHRKGTGTRYGASEAFRQYISQASYAAMIDPQISVIRGIGEDLRERVDPEDVNKSNSIANFVTYLDEFANDIAGKTNSIDRPFQKLIGRDNMAALQRLTGKAKASMVLYNVSSMFAQILNVPNGIAEVGDIKCCIRAMADMFESVSENGEVRSEMYGSQFLTERYANNHNRYAFVEGKNDFVRSAKYARDWLANIMLSIFDNVGTRYIWSAAYRKGKKLGVDAVRYADDITRRSVGGRGIGEMSLVQRSKLVGNLLPLTVEAGNNLRVMSDIQRRFKKTKDVRKYIEQLLTLFIMKAFFDYIIKEIRGSGSGDFNPIGVTVKGIMENKEWYQILGMVSGNLISSTPVGNIAVSTFYPENGNSILPSSKDIFGTEDPTRYGDAELIAVLPVRSVWEAGCYIYKRQYADAAKSLTALMPGGSQVKKSVVAIEALNRGYTTTSGGNKKFDVSKKPENIVKGVLFGQSAFREADEYYNMPDVKIKTKGTEGFKYNKKSRKITVGEGVLAKEIELSGDELQAFESDRFTEYKRLYTDITSGEYKLQNPYNRLTEAKKYTQANKDFKARLKELYEQGSIDRARYTQYYTDYKLGNEVFLSGLEFAVRAKETVCKKYSELTPAQKKAYQNNLRSLYKKGEMTKEKYDDFMQYLKEDGEVYVKEIITGDFGSLNDEQKKLVVSKMNSMATEYAKGKLK